jgi:hypothetical protein
MRLYLPVVGTITIILLMSAAAGALAWSGPTAPPPGGNVAAPINVGTAFQDKPGPVWFDGGLGINGGSALCIGTSCITSWAQAGSSTSQWTTSGTSIYYSTGKVGINTAAPAATLEVDNNGTSNTVNLLQYGNRPILSLQRADGSASTPSALAAGDIIGNINFSGYNGWLFGSAAAIKAYAAEAFSTTGQGSDLTFSTTPIGATAVSEAMRIASTGNVGIGTTNPAQKLDVNGAVKATQYCIGTSCITSWATGGVAGSGSAGYLARFTGASTLGNSLLYDSGTNVGIGTASPSNKLEVNGNLTVDGGQINGLSGGIAIGPVAAGWYSDGTNLAARFPGASGDFYVQNQGGTATYLEAGAGVGGATVIGNVNASGSYCRGGSCGWSGTIDVPSTDPSLVYAAKYGAGNPGQLNNCTYTDSYGTTYAPGTLTLYQADPFYSQSSTYTDQHYAYYALTYAGGIVVGETTHTTCATFLNASQPPYNPYPAQ